ncbi:MAG: hypothetical protein IJ662_02725, partial [Clostridia bacterium]|nr:hypothetical protein [Clostridia bacterium]
QDSALIRNIHFLQKWVFDLQGGQKPDFRGRKWIAEAAFSRTSQFGIVAQGSAQAQPPGLCASLGLHLPVSATGGGRFRPSATYTPPPAE